MRLIVHGQQAYGKSVLEAILDKGLDEVVAVYSAPDKEGRPLDPLKEYALEQDLPVYQPESYKNPEVWEQLASHEADLCVMAYVLLFVPEEALNVPKYGSIQYHPSLLPWHKGPSSINWPIIMGKQKTGLSIFWPDNGLDTGPILLQKEVDIGPDDTLGSIYFDKLFPLGVEAMMESIELVRDGKAPKVVQDPDDGSYEGLVYLPCTADNGFLPEIPDERLDVIYLCYPNNPTGAMIDRAHLEAWVAYAQRHEAIIMYDVAYQAFVSDQIGDTMKLLGYT